jgi:two-component system, chemotaxis family, chemotaxis protein CheY
MALNILVVDDSAMMRKMVIRTLKLGGLPVATLHEAGDGAEALSILGSTPIDLLMMDINMPIMTGLEALSKARASPKLAQLPIIMVSTEGSDIRVEEIRRMGASFLRKPFTPESLVDAVLTAIGGNDANVQGAASACDGPDF